MEKFKSPTGILKINIDNENAVGLGVKTTMKKDKQGQNSHQEKSVQNST